ncbi:MAG TPA: hypothetical protein DEQ14_05105 [Treponema sp.]|nr:hypothetical protein [Treponema sp.]
MLRAIIIFLFIIFLALLTSGCATGGGNGIVVSDNGNGTAEYRGIQEQIRSGETELAITGARIESASAQLKHASGELAAGIGSLEQSIIGAAGTEREITTIIQRVRSRPVDAAFVKEWRDCRNETGSGEI